jgi:hypothetical protein
MKSIIIRSISIAAVFFLFLIPTESFAQYNTGIGLRLGTGNGFTVKHFVTQQGAVEALIYSRWSGLIVSGLYEVHFDISEVRGLQWFVGGGAHFGTWNAGNHNLPRVPKREGMQTFGLDGIIGLDYKIYNAPVNLSFDWKPAVNFNESAGFWWDELALSVRFAF